MSSHSELSPQPLTTATPPLTILLSVLILIFFFLGFFSLFFCRCFMRTFFPDWQVPSRFSGNIADPDIAPVILGLDPSLIQLFPTFTYSSVKDYRREKYGIECAICLGEFVDDDMLRLITVCYHVFHRECIDLWLESHKTCPVCRRDLELPTETETGEKTLTLDQINESNALPEHSIRIAISEDDDEDGQQGRAGNGEESVRGAGNGQTEMFEKVDRFSRSHSTGHSIVANREEEDKYTLRLLENVKVKITRGHNTAGSCITFGDFSSPRNRGFGEVSGCSGEDISKV